MTYSLKHVGRENLVHLLNTLKTFYNNLYMDWEGKLFCGMALNWNYQNKQFDLSTPGYI